MNNKGYAKLVLFGIPVGALIILGFQMWATGLVIDAISPELENMLRQLDDKMICPPELSTSDYSVCLGKNGEVVVNGILNKDLAIQLDENQNICSIKAGVYNSEQLCVLNDIWRAEKMYVAGMGFFNKKTIQVSKLISYTKSGQYLRALKILKYLPK